MTDTATTQASNRNEGVTAAQKSAIDRLLRHINYAPRTLAELARITIRYVSIYIFLALTYK